MRLTKEELLKKYPWNTSNSYNGDIVAVLYGDIPHIHYTHDRVRMENSDRYGYFDNDMDDIISAINGINHYIFSQCGEFSNYYTLIGDVRVFKDWFIGTADLQIKYNGKTYNLTLNDLYGDTKLSLSLITSSIYRTYDINDDRSWISTRWTPMSKEEALKVVDVKRVADYGDIIKMAVEKCRKIIEEN
jgi:hypothetical protein